MKANHFLNGGLLTSLAIICLTLVACPEATRVDIPAEQDAVEIPETGEAEPAPAPAAEPPGEDERILSPTGEATTEGDTPRIGEPPLEPDGGGEDLVVVLEVSRELPAPVSTYPDGGGELPAEGESALYIPGTAAGMLAASRTEDKINVFFRRYDPDKGEGYLCRVMGPPELVWGGKNRAQTACFEDYAIDYPPQVIFDPNRRKIHVFAMDHTGDLGGAHGYRYFSCDADSINCTAATHLILESKTHFYPALVLAKGATAAADRIHGFVHGGYGGQLLHFVLDPNNMRFGWSWAGDKMGQDYKGLCGRYLNIDRSPYAFIRKGFSGEEFHLIARDGDGHLIHLSLYPSMYRKFISGEDYRFLCQKIYTEGSSDVAKPFSMSPYGLVRGDNRLDIFGGFQVGSYYGPRMWASRFIAVAELQLNATHTLETPTEYRDFAGGGLAVNMHLLSAPEERLSVVTESDEPDSTAHIFANIHEIHAVEGFPIDHAVHFKMAAGGASKSTERLSFSFGGRPAAVRDSKGNLHVFAAEHVAGSTGHFRLTHAARPIDESFPWVNFPIAPGKYIERKDPGDGKTGVTAIVVPGSNPAQLFYQISNPTE